LNKQQSVRKPKTISPVNLSVIDSPEAAKAKYSAKALFILNRIRERIAQEEMFAYEKELKAERQHIFREEAKAEWVIAKWRQPDVVQYWESKSRSQILRQPHIRNNIIEAMRANPTKSFEKIAEDIGHWCSASTIHKWIQSKCTTDPQRTMPLLTTRRDLENITDSVE
jgi:hypothetical protein